MTEPSSAGARPPGRYQDAHTMKENDPTRRDVLRSLAALPFLATAVEAQIASSPVAS